MTPAEQWNSPEFQDAIRAHDEALGHLPAGRSVHLVAFFHPPARPTGGGTVFLRPSVPDVPGETQ